MPPPHLMIFNDDPPANYMEDPEFLPSHIPGTRQLAQPIPIAAVHPITEPQSYSLGSQETIMSDISDSLRPSPPPLTATSSLPTPYSIRTPATTSASTSTAMPRIASPTSPTLANTTAEEDQHIFVQGKPFPRSSGLSEASGSRDLSREITPVEVGSQDVDMDNEEEDEIGHQIASPDAVDQHESEGTLGTSAPRGSLTRLLRDIGNPSTSSIPSQVPPYIQPLLDQRTAVFGSRWSHPAPSTSRETSTHSGPSSLRGSIGLMSDEQEGNGEPFLNELGPLPGGSHNDESGQDFRSFRYEQPYHQSTYHQPAPTPNPYHPATAGGYLNGNWGEAYSSHPSVSHSQMSTGSSRISPSRLRSPVSPPLSNDIRTLPSPATNTAAVSPSSIERRLGTIEARLERARGRAQRSPPTPPMLVPSHQWEGFRNRHNAARPYDIASRSRPSSYSAEDGSRSSSFTRSSVRPSWLESASVSTTSAFTVPPPRPSPITSFGWETSDTHPHGATFTSTTRPSQAFSRSTENSSSFDDRQAIQRENSRARYLQARLNMLDDMRTAPSTAAWSNLPVHNRTDFPLRDGSEDINQSHVERSTSYNQPNSSAGPFGDRSTPRSSSHAFPIDYSGAEPPNGDMRYPNLTRPGVRRWMSFDEGERESSRAREEHRPSEETNDLGALNRDINEVVGRRLSQSRPRATSVTRRLRDHLGPDWEDTQLPDTASSTPGNSARIGRSGANGLFGEIDRSRDTQQRDTRDSTSPWWSERREPYAEMMRDRSATSSPIDELAALIASRGRNRPLLGGEEAELLFLERLRSHNNGTIRSASSGGDGSIMTFRNNEGLEGIMDITADSPFSAFTFLNNIRRYQSYPTTPITSIKITDEMDESEKIKIVQMVIKGISRLPAIPRKKAAESTLHTIQYDQFTSADNVKTVEGLEKDEYCSVCHDDYEAESEITITPCKHMYHKGCLDTWLTTPNTSSCPMCRRDLAALAYLTKMVPSKNLEEALSLWMAVVV
ncbi:uncharacterized protein L201_000312 [Kwoniella dendrophila CBS 6074]|uniref:RING-type domain-containing protein n=1 Tax=Kwoniella dendrophila CBS 6074 TaxID=1295534 RepID=A0AAX4JL17_9TREE